MAKRKTKREPEPEEDLYEEIPLCAAPGCVSPALAAGEFCFIHLGLDLAMDKLQKSMRKNDVTGAIMGGVGLLLFNPQITGAVAARVAPGPVPGAPPPPPPRPQQPDPWALLGLDPGRATAEDVKRVQRALAKLYHADAGAGGVDPRRMAAVNAAAQACLADLKKRGR